jgi:hypothetical protein
MIWRTPPGMWAGQTVAVLASGPSMTPRVAEAVRSIPTIVINDSFREAPWAALLYAADEEWWRLNPDAHAFAGLKASVASVPGVRLLRNTGSSGFDPEPGCIRTGSNSGYQGVHIAAQAGARRILLCGFDMSAAKGAHWFGEHQRGLINTSPETYQRFIGRFDSLKVELDRIGVEVLNCTPDSALKCFPMVSLDDALRLGRRPLGNDNRQPTIFGEGQPADRRRHSS